MRNLDLDTNATTADGPDQAYFIAAEQAVQSAVAAAMRELHPYLGPVGPSEFALTLERRIRGMIKLARSNNPPDFADPAPRRVFIDMDGVSVDFDGYRRAHGLTVDDIKATPGAYARMAPMPGAIEAIRALIEMGYEVWFAAKPATCIAHTYSDKASWVFEHVPELSHRIILTHNKGLLGGPNDTLIDDALDRAACEGFAGSIIEFNPAAGWDWPRIVHFLTP